MLHPWFQLLWTLLPTAVQVALLWLLGPEFAKALGECFGFMAGIVITVLVVGSLLLLGAVFLVVTFCVRRARAAQACRVSALATAASA